MKFKEIEKKKLKRKYEFTIKAKDLDNEVNEKLGKTRQKTTSLHDLIVIA